MAEKYYKAFIVNKKKKYWGDFRGNYKYYNGGQFTSRKGYCVATSPQACIQFMNCHLSDGEELKVCEVHVLNPVSDNGYEFIFKTFTIVSVLSKGRDY